MSIFQTKDPVAEENVLRQKVELVLNRQTETLHQLTAITKELETLTKIVARLSVDRPKPQISEQLVFADDKESAPVVNVIYMASKRDISRMHKLNDFMSGAHPVTIQTMMAVWACSKKAAEATLYRFRKDQRYEVVETKTQGQPSLYLIKEVS
tara:strand:- start:7368 stop:7826 length:459 start_codon:yes stop_codon:yes gene_type:complete